MYQWRILDILLVNICKSPGQTRCLTCGRIREHLRDHRSHNIYTLSSAASGGGVVLLLFPGSLFRIFRITKIKEVVVLYVLIIQSTVLHNGARLGLFFSHLFELTIGAGCFGI
jgi:hypothetical protein